MRIAFDLFLLDRFNAFLLVEVIFIVELFGDSVPILVASIGSDLVGGAAVL